ARFSQFPCREPQLHGSLGSGGSGQILLACPGGREMSAFKMELICEMIWLAVVCCIPLCCVFEATGSNAMSGSREMAATPSAKVTSTSEKPAVRRRNRFMLPRILVFAGREVNAKRGGNDTVVREQRILIACKFLPSRQSY